jgi:hypothetical protein
VAVEDPGAGGLELAGEGIDIPLYLLQVRGGRRRSIGLLGAE